MCITLKRLTRCIWEISEFILETIAPHDPEIRRIEQMHTADFIQGAHPSVEDANKALISLFSYKDKTVKLAILEVKLYGNKKIAELLGTCAFEHLTSELSDLELFHNFASPILLPIPITGKIRKKRGWNQCELIAEGLRRADKEKYLEIRTDILYKTQETGDQVGKNRQERFENLKNCFGVKNPEKVRGRNVIILDDVMTTGATLSEAKRVLKAAGAKKVLCVAIAH